MDNYEKMIMDYLSTICKMKKIRTKLKYNFAKVYIIGGEQIERDKKDYLIAQLYKNLDITFGDVPFEILEKWLIRNF